MNNIELVNEDTGEVIILTPDQYDRFFENRDPQPWFIIEDPTIETPATFKIGER